HLVSVQRMAAENAQMAPQQPAGVKRSHDVGRKPRNSIHSSSYAKLRLPRDFLSDRSNALVEIAFGFDKLAVSIFGLGRARTQRAISSLAANRANEVLVAGDVL